MPKLHKHLDIFPHFKLIWREIYTCFEFTCLRLLVLAPGHPGLVKMEVICLSKLFGSILKYC